MSDPLRLLLAQEHTLYRECLTVLLESRAEFKVIADASTAGQAMAELERERPDVALLDSDLPERGALELTRSIRSQHRGLPVLILGPEQDTEMLSFAEAGASGCVPRDTTLEELGRSIRLVTLGGSTYPHRITPYLVSRLSELSGWRDTGTPTSRSPTLTRRELEILELVSEGLANKEIASRLHLSLYTVKNHVHNILEKLQVSGRWAAVAYACRQRWLPGPGMVPAAPSGPLSGG